MEWIWIVLGILLILAGLAGSLLPILPGPPLAYAGLLMQALRDPSPFSSKFLWIWAAVVAVLAVLDYLIPVWGAKRYGGTKYGMWGCSIGFLLAFWMGPLGIIVGPFLGAFVGELMARRTEAEALRAAWGPFIGFLFSSVLKLVICGMFLYYLIASI